MDKLFKKISKQKVSEVRRELSRAHFIIALLSLAMIALLMQGSYQPIALDPVLSIIAAILLTVVALTSLLMSFALTFGKTK